MSLTIKRSLFETSEVSSLESATGWMTGLLNGSLGVSLAVLAVAIVGFGALGGRLSLLRGGQTIIGVFVLFGASTIASSFAVGSEDLEPAQPSVVFDADQLGDPRLGLSPATSDLDRELAEALQSDDLSELISTEDLRTLRFDELSASGSETE
jgi:type IV secretion system protein VirB2